MKLSFKIYIAVLSAIVIGSVFFFVYDKTNSEVVSQSKILVEFNRLEVLDHQLEDEVLKSAYLLYYNYDNIELLIRKIEELIAQLDQNRNLNKPVYNDVLKQLHHYKGDIYTKITDIHKFQTLNSLIKNSSNQIPSLTQRYLTTFQVTEKNLSYLEILGSIVNNIFITKNSQDDSFIKELQDKVELLENLEIEDPKQRKFNDAFIAHVNIFNKFFPEYSNTIEKILNLHTHQELLTLNQKYHEISSQELKYINYLSILTAIAFILSILIIIRMLWKSDTKNKKLIQLQHQLQRAATTDSLTGLMNRFAFDSDQKSQPGYSLILLEIHGITHINEFYGFEAGDMVLREASRIIIDTTQKLKNIGIYRIGNNNFAILSFNEAEDFSDTLLSTQLINIIENGNFTYSDNKLIVHSTAAVSNEQPLLITADMVLKYVKKSRFKCMTYSKSLELEKTVEHNLDMIKLLKSAISEKRVVPFYQPIVDNASGEIRKYEALIRIRETDGSIMSPDGFLTAAKKTRLYTSLTRIMIVESFKTFSLNNHELSLNLSVEDTLDNEITRTLFELIESHKDIANRLTIELLESEEIEDYDKVISFIRRLKKYECKIALDDFGSGYSNLEHTLKLSPDIVKIDGSLIRNLDTDRNMFELVKSIISICNSIGVKQIIAEFVHNETIHNIVKSLGIHFSQGYYFGKPEPEIIHRPTSINHANLN